MVKKPVFSNHRLETLYDEIKSLSYEQQLILYVTSIAREDLRFQMTFLRTWITALRESKAALRMITIKASAAYVTNGFAKKDASTIEALVETRIENDPDLTPGELAGELLGQLGLEPKMKPMLMAAIRRVKERRRQRKVKAAKRSRNRQTVFDRILSEGTYRLAWQVPAIAPAADPVVNPDLYDDNGVAITTRPENL